MRTLLFIMLLLVAPICGCDRTAKKSGAAAPATRLVVLSPALAAILRDLGAGDQMVGRHGFDAWSDQAIAVCGDQAGVDYEGLVRANPSHVLMQWSGRELPERLTALASERAWALQDFSLLTLADIRSATVKLGAISGREGAAGEVIAKMDRAWAPREGVKAAGRVLLLYSTDPPTVLGPGSFHHQLLEAIGGTPAVTEGKPFITLDAEGVLRLKPDTIVLIQPRAPGSAAADGRWETIEGRLGALGHLEVPAVTRRRVVLIDDPLCAIPGSNMIELADRLRAALDGLR